MQGRTLSCRPRCWVPFDLYPCQLLLEPSKTVRQGWSLLSLLFDYNLVFQRILKTDILELTIVVLSKRNKELIYIVILEVELAWLFEDTI
jgi:hypothetical protein